ncbi:MAG TPA: polyhydroxyalkanoate synthesis regulator DNA-binding domain-containing protein [Thermodesulfobacteriota bacterium]|nr:polyhydroxyalkanoate synthesis regulator DNA-binding domain-containing protein [Thermodesulfobacteriota bacterium]
MAGQVIIKKYSNRRLYDTNNKRYVTLEEIANIIKEGNEVKVLDSQTDEDITKVILIQVVLESEKNKVDILPTSFLHMLIKYGNRIAKDFFENYFLMMFQPYLSFQESMKKNLRWWQEVGWLPPGMKPPIPTRNLEEANSGGRYDGEKDSASEETQFLPPQMLEMEFLRQRVKELEEKVKSIDKPKKSRAKEKHPG